MMWQLFVFGGSHILPWYRWVLFQFLHGPCPGALGVPIFLWETMGPSDFRELVSSISEHKLAYCFYACLLEFNPSLLLQLLCVDLLAPGRSGGDYYTWHSVPSSLLMQDLNLLCPYSWDGLIGTFGGGPLSLPLLTRVSLVIYGLGVIYSPCFGFDVSTLVIHSIIISGELMSFGPSFGGPPLLALSLVMVGVFLGAWLFRQIS